MSKEEIGMKAEAIAFSYEKLRLNDESGSLVKLVSDESALGFDIQSVNDITDHSPRYIEVKSANNQRKIFLTERERRNLTALGNSAWLYIVDTRRNKILEMIQDPMAHTNGQESPILYNVKV